MHFVLASMNYGYVGIIRVVRRLCEIFTSSATAIHINFMILQKLSGVHVYTHVLYSVHPWIGWGSLVLCYYTQFLDYLLK